MFSFHMTHSVKTSLRFLENHIWFRLECTRISFSFFAFYNFCNSTYGFSMFKQMKWKPLYFNAFIYALIFPCSSPKRTPYPSSHKTHTRHAYYNYFNRKFNIKSYKCISTQFIPGFIVDITASCASRTACKTRKLEKEPLNNKMPQAIHPIICVQFCLVPI